MEKAFNFKLLVPPRPRLGLGTAQVSAVKPQDPVLYEDNSSFTAAVQSLNKCFENEPILSIKMPYPTESPRPVIPLLFTVCFWQPQLKASQLYSKLFEEAEKIKAWKMKTDYNILQKERTLQENRRTIETQRRAIQELQRMIAAFENLRQQAEADRIEMLKAKEGLKQFEELKVRFENDYHMKEEKVCLLEEKQREKKSQLIEISFKLQEAQKNFSELQESANQHLHNCGQQQNALREQLKREEQLRLESEEKQKSLVNTLEQTKEMYENKLLENDIKLKEINYNKEQLAHQIKEIQMTAESAQFSLTSEKIRVQELESKLNSVSQEVSIKNKEIEITREEKVECDSQIQALKFEMENALKSFDEKTKADELKVLQLALEHEEKNKEIGTLKEKLEIAVVENKSLVASIEDAVTEQNLLKEHCRMKEIKLQAIEGQLAEALKKDRESANNITNLKSDVSQYKDKYDDLLERFNQLQKSTVQQEGSNAEEMKETLENMKIEVGKLEMEKQQLQKQLELLNGTIEKQHQEKENIQKQLKETNKSSQIHLAKKERQVKALELKVQKWKQASLEATKSKEDTEIKFQQKISDMVALMERHKHEYDKMVEEKDAELNEKRMREAEINANKTSLELELSYLQVENVQFKQNIDVIKMEKEYLEKETIALKKQIESPEKDKAQKSFRIRTPPSTEKSAPWRKNMLELDPKSDSSEQNDVLSFSTVLNKQTKHSKTEGLGLFNKVQGSAIYKSPGAALKLAAIKRMRDAGWTTITSSDKKKKKVTEKIFA
ncbi:Synaptonemal complex protein 1 [Bagarius yarrelli]|uniref:Synaptonemal complex protein 1 n=1 Tax=Bagarius yarrelli TaxID=175774 RepID=A0A556VXV1_BAGYA|nr:Synaptonemal complex protein 1 [Bagarius yarrelli]